MWNRLKKNPLLNSQPDYPITRTLLSAAKILEIEEDFGRGFLFQAKIIEELARRVKALERQNSQCSQTRPL